VIVVTIGEERGRLRRARVCCGACPFPPGAVLVVTPASPPLDTGAAGAEPSRLATRADVCRSRPAPSRERRAAFDREPAAGPVARVERGGAAATDEAPAGDGATTVEEGDAVAVVAATGAVTGAGEAGVADGGWAVAGSDVAVPEVEVEPPVAALVTSLDGFAFWAACVCPGFPRAVSDEAESPAPRRACPP
jgi:hypothetical protein